MTHARLHLSIGSLTIIGIGLALLNWKLAPESANSWIAAIVTLPVIWIIAGLKMKHRARFLSDMEQKFFTTAVILAGLLLTVSLAAKLIGNLYDVDAGIITRIREVFLGIVLLYVFNMIPKMIGPRIEGKCGGSAANSLRRFSAWVLVLGALGYIGAWIFAPISQAGTIAQIFVAGAVIIVAARVVIALISGRRIAP